MIILKRNIRSGLTLGSGHVRASQEAIVSWQPAAGLWYLQWCLSQSSALGAV